MLGVLACHDREAAASLIRWWRDAGVDTLVEDDARDWLAPPSPLLSGERDGRAAARERGRVMDGPSPGVAPLRHPLPGGERVELPATLDSLLAWLCDSTDAPEARWGGRRVLPAGDPQSGLMILIDAPDPADAQAGQLLSGELGALFDKMLAAIGRDRGSVWLAPFATVRPLGRVPQATLGRLAEITRHHIGLIAPKRLLMMGDAPCRALLGTEVIPARGRLHVLDHGAATVEAVATFHPRLLNERPAFKAQAWKDLQLLAKGL